MNYKLLLLFFSINILKASEISEFDKANLNAFKAATELEFQLICAKKLVGSVKDELKMHSKPTKKVISNHKKKLFDYAKLNLDSLELNKRLFSNDIACAIENYKCLKYRPFNTLKDKMLSFLKELDILVDVVTKLDDGIWMYHFKQDEKEIQEQLPEFDFPNENDDRLTVLKELINVFFSVKSYKNFNTLKHFALIAQEDKLIKSVESCQLNSILYYITIYSQKLIFTLAAFGEGIESYLK